MIPMFQYPIFLDFIIPKSYHYVFAGNYDYDEYLFKPPNSISDYILIGYNNFFAFSLIFVIRIMAVILPILVRPSSTKKS